MNTDSFIKGFAKGLEKRSAEFPEPASLGKKPISEISLQQGPKKAMTAEARARQKAFFAGKKVLKPKVGP